MLTHGKVCKAISRIKILFNFFLRNSAQSAPLWTIATCIFNYCVHLALKNIEKVCNSLGYLRRGWWWSYWDKTWLTIRLFTVPYFSMMAARWTERTTSTISRKNGGCEQSSSPLKFSQRMYNVNIYSVYWLVPAPMTVNYIKLKPLVNMKIIIMRLCVIL